MTRRIEMLNPSPLEYKNGLNENDTLHRYCSVTELYQTAKGSLSLTCPFNWDDPFESWLFRAKLIGRKGNNIDLGSQKGSRKPKGVSPRKPKGVSPMFHDPR